MLVLSVGQGNPKPQAWLRKFWGPYMRLSPVNEGVCMCAHMHTCARVCDPCSGESTPELQMSSENSIRWLLAMNFLGTQFLAIFLIV